MSVDVVRTADGWWVVGDGRAVAAETKAATTAELLADRDAVTAAADRLASGTGTVPAAGLAALSPVTVPCRVVGQAVNYRSHARDSGMDDTRVPPTFFRKASHSVSGPEQDIVRPDHVRLLDHEVELGIVVGTHMPVGTVVTDADLHRYVGALVVTNDVSAREIQLTQGQFYEGKSYPTFTPVGPYLTLPDAQDLLLLPRLRLTLDVNGERRQDGAFTDMIVRPAEALTLLSRFQPLEPGDLLLTGTPGGTALKAPPKIVEKIGALLPPHRKWAAFFGRAAKDPAFLKPGDVVTARIATPDGALDLGTQTTRVVAGA